MMDFALKDRNVVIVGGSTGIGYEVARQFANQEANVIVTSHTGRVFDAEKSLSAECRRPVKGLEFDVGDRAQVKAAFADLDGIDTLINNAATVNLTRADDRSDATAESFERQIQVNLTGLYWCAQEAVPKMTDGGRIIFTSSTWGKVGAPGYAAYNASKHGMIGLVKTMALDLGSLGISVNAVCPGSVATEMNVNELSDEMKARATGQMCLRPGLIEIEHLAGIYLFLASDAASEMTGQAICIDRGQTIAGSPS